MWYTQSWLSKCKLTTQILFEAKNKRNICISLKIYANESLLDFKYS